MSKSIAIPFYLHRGSVFPWNRFLDTSSKHHLHTMQISPRHRSNITWTSYKCYQTSFKNHLNINQTSSNNHQYITRTSWCTNTSQTHHQNHNNISAIIQNKRARGRKIQRYIFETNQIISCVRPVMSVPYPLWSYFRPSVPSVRLVVPIPWSMSSSSVCSSCCPSVGSVVIP